MPFISSNPTKRNGKVFDLLGLSLITNPQFKADRVGANVVFQAYPYRIDEQGKPERPTVIVDTEDGSVEVVDATATRSIIHGDAYIDAQQDSDLAECLIAISAALQKYIVAKGW